MCPSRLGVCRYFWMFHAGIFFVQPIDNDPDGDLLGFSLTLPNTYDMRRDANSKQALDYAEGKKWILNLN